MKIWIACDDMTVTARKMQVAWNKPPFFLSFQPVSSPTRDAMTHKHNPDGIHQLATDTIRHLNSGQVIVHLDNVVKELVENALDAKATSIEVKLVENGLASLSVKDNGVGIRADDRPNMARRYYTSKLSCFEDLTRVTSYGFRGEALNSICSISQSTQITTRTALDPVAISYDLDKTGAIISSKPAGTTSTPGTTVTVHKLFYNLPVRRQQAQKTVPATTKRVHDLLTAYSLVHPHIRFAVKNAPETAGTKTRWAGTGAAGDWVKPAVDGTMDAVRKVFGGEIAGTVEWWVEGEEEREEERKSGEEEEEEEKEKEHKRVRIEAMLARVDANPTVACRGDRVFVYVNDRPVSHSRGEMKRVVAMVRDKYAEAVERKGGKAIPKKTPFIFLNFKIPPSSYDVNVEPSKNAVLLHHPQRILDIAERLLERVYGTEDIRKVANASVTNGDTETSVQQAPIPTPSPTGFAPTTVATTRHLASSHDHVIPSTDGLLADTDTQNVVSPPTATVPATTVSTTMVPSITIPTITTPATPQSPKQNTAEVTLLTPSSAACAVDGDGAWHFSMFDEVPMDTLEEVPSVPVDARKPINLAEWARGMRAGSRAGDIEREASEDPTSLVEHVRLRRESEAAVPSIHDNNDEDDDEPLEDRRFDRAKRQRGSHTEPETKSMATRMAEAGAEVARTPRRERKAEGEAPSTSTGPFGVSPRVAGTGLSGGKASRRREASNDDDDAGRRVRQRLGESIERRSVEDDNHGAPLFKRRKESTDLAVKTPPPTAKTSMEKQTPPPTQSSPTCPSSPTLRGLLAHATSTTPREDSVVPASTQSSNPGREAITPAASPLPSSTSGTLSNAFTMLRRESVAPAPHARPAPPALPRKFTQSHQPTFPSTVLSPTKSRSHSRLLNFTKFPSASTLHEHAVVSVLPIAAARSRYGQFRGAWVRGYRVGMTGYVGLEEESKGNEDARVAGRVGETHWVVGWTGAEGRCVSVGVVDGKRAKEMVVYRDLLSHFDLSPKQQLDHPIQFTISVDDPAYSALLLLFGHEEDVIDSAHSDTRTTYTIIEDSRVVKNGFRVRWKMDQSHHTALLYITSLTSLIPHYGSEDLRALLLALAGEPTLTPSALRPKKAQEYFAREARHKVEEDGAGGAEEEAVRGVVMENIEWTKKEEEVAVIGVEGRVMGVKVWGVQRERCEMDALLR